MEYKLIYVVMFLCVLMIPSSLETFRNGKEPTNFKEIKDNVMDLVNSVAEWLVPMAHKIIEESNISMPCTLSLFRFFTDVKKLRNWALEMLDASAKPSAGIIRGTVTFLGDYDECLEIIARNERMKHLFIGKYCMVHLYMPNVLIQQFLETNLFGSSELLEKLANSLTELQNNQLYLFYGLCVPSLCAAQEINQIVNTVTESYGFLTKVTCETKTTKEPTTVQIVILCIFALFGSLVVIGTIIDLINQHANCKLISGRVKKLIITFSFYSNTVQLFRIVERERKIAVIRGCRVLTMFWIVLGHVYFGNEFNHFYKYRGISENLKFVRQFMFRTVMGGIFAIETFFLLSGMLSVYTIWNKLQPKGWTNPVTHFIPKLARILSTEMLVVALFMVLPLFGTGPIWDETFKETYTACVKNWWANLLFVQNFLPHQEICLKHTWFLGTWFQLNLITFGVLIALYRWPRVGISINVLLVLIGCFVTGILTASYNLPASQTDFFDHLKGWLDFYNIIYFRPYTFIPSYCIGIFLGYFIVTKECVKINKWIQLVCWLLATCGALTLLYGMHFLRSHSNELRTAYAALHRTIWSASISWVLFSCFSGYGGIIGRILSWKAMIPLDRLCMLLYLLHPLVLHYYTARIRTTINMDHVEQVYIFLASIVITVGCSTLFNGIFLQPLNGIRLLLFNTPSRNAFLDDTCQENQVPVRNKMSTLPPVSINSSDSKLEEAIVTKF